ncbi:hypothetical protein HMF7854_11030 [Sphingomonas ginkgonis]|uniref:Uncharacterized protein n=1 Tax=Sphingomonas ginkgonis TaxID=2315330 RepID=A0A3R9Y6N3_9SPHN|nr:hypothetical protein [Sphingomonas ginkgonis]RST31311.1 hypothetical protein HMF7854_11030 [Sphingomonas ginkgonis]
MAIGVLCGSETHLSVCWLIHQARTILSHWNCSSPVTRSSKEIEQHLRSIDPKLIHRGTGDEAFGRMLQLRTPDGLVKVIELQRDLIE